MPIALWPAYLIRLAAGILALQAPYSKVSVEQAMSYAASAAFHAQQSGEDAFELVALARNESDFIADQVGPDGKDCGITQTRVTNSRYTCEALRSSADLSFAEAARELSEYRRACRYAVDFDRCRFNRYNSGVRYARTGVHGRYWLRVMCFADAARNQVSPGNACRRVTSVEEIDGLIGQLVRERKAPSEAEEVRAGQGG